MLQAASHRPPRAFDHDLPDSAVQFDSPLLSARVSGDVPMSQLTGPRNEVRTLKPDCGIVRRFRARAMNGIHDAPPTPSGQQQVEAIQLRSNSGSVANNLDRRPKMPTQRASLRNSRRLGEKRLDARFPPFGLVTRPERRSVQSVTHMHQFAADTLLPNASFCGRPKDVDHIRPITDGSAKQSDAPRQTRIVPASPFIPRHSQNKRLRDTRALPHDRTILGRHPFKDHRVRTHVVQESTITLPVTDLANGLLQQTPKGSAECGTEKRRQRPAFPNQFRAQIEVQEVHRSLLARGRVSQYQIAQSITDPSLTRFIHQTSQRRILYRSSIVKNPSNGLAQPMILALRTRGRPARSLRTDTSV